MYEEFTVTQFADRSSLSLLPIGVLGLHRVDTGLLHALLVVGKAAEGAEDHLFAILKLIAARRALLDCFGLLDGCLTEKYCLLVLIVVCMAAHLKLCTFLIEGPNQFAFDLLRIEVKLN